MSKLRPELKTGGWQKGDPFLTYDATYYRVFEAVKNRRALIHGRLDDGAYTCAIGAYFREANIAINSKALDEIAAYNDSFPKLTRHERWRKVLAWLRTRVVPDR